MPESKVVQAGEHSRSMYSFAQLPNPAQELFENLRT